MKTYNQLIGDALIKIGIGCLGGGLFAGVINDKSYLPVIFAMVIGPLLIHIGAKLAQASDDENE